MDWFEKGLALSKAKKYKEEIEAYKQAVNIKPDYSEAHFNLGLSYIILGDRDSALAEYKILKDLDPQMAKNLYEKAIIRASLSKDNKYIAQAGANKNIDNANKLIEKSMADNQYESRTIYTIQTGSFIKVVRAQKQFESIIQGLNGKGLDYLRIEKIEKFYVVRFGKFDDYAAAEKFLQSIKPQLSIAIILKAYIKDDRIIRLYKKPIFGAETGKKN